MDLAKFFKVASAEIARSERKQFTGRVEIRVCYRNGKPRKGSVKKTECRIFNREPIDSSLRSPEHDIAGLHREMISDDIRSDSEICLSYSFFCGTVVDRGQELLNILC